MTLHARRRCRAKCGGQSPCTSPTESHRYRASMNLTIPTRCVLSGPLPDAEVVAPAVAVQALLPVHVLRLALQPGMSSSAAAHSRYCSAGRKDSASNDASIPDRCCAIPLRETPPDLLPRAQKHEVNKSASTDFVVVVRRGVRCIQDWWRCILRQLPAQLAEAIGIDEIAALRLQTHVGSRRGSKSPALGKSGTWPCK